jgi:GNAT superfamily N-acetyltransferase
MIIRRVRLDDMDALIELRINCLRAMDGLTEEQEAQIREMLEPYFTEHLDRDLIAAAAEEDYGNEIVSTAFLVISEWPPKPSSITGRIGTLLNVFTYPEYRSKGTATKVVSFLLEEAKRINVSVVDLTASPDGKPIYEKLGFKEPHYTAMSLRLI